MTYPANSEMVFTASHLLASMRNGAANDAATLELEKLVKAVAETGKAGDVSLKFKVSKLKDGDTEMSVQIVVKSNIPVGDIPKGIYYPGEDGSLHRTDPRQGELLEHKRQDGDVNKVGRGILGEVGVNNDAGLRRGNVSTIDGEARRG